MTREEAIAIIENEKKCVNRANKNDYCNRDCYNCELVKTDIEILDALNMAIVALEEEPKIGKWILIDKELSRYKCSECGEVIKLYKKSEISNLEKDEVLSDYPFSHCGAKMVEPQESEG